MDKLPKTYLNELLDNYYDERNVLLECIKFYENKNIETANLNLVWKAMLDDAQHKLKELDITIQYTQEELK